MDKETNRNVKLGVFVILGIILFVVGIFFIGSKDNMFTKNMRISTVFKNTGGLAQGNYVHYNGVKVGVVKAVTLVNDTTVQVDMMIEKKKRAFIRKTDIATIASEGLMGGKLVNILPGETSSLPVEENDFIKSSNPQSTDVMMKTLGETNENMKVISYNLKKLTTDLNESRGTLQTLMSDSVMAGDMQQSFSNVRTLTSKLISVSSGMQDIINDVNTGKNSVGAILNDTMLAKNLETSVSQFKTTSDQLLKLTDELSTTTTMINSGDGPVTTLLTDSVMANNLQQSMENLKKSSQAFNENMEALKHSFPLRGYYKKQEKEKKKQQEDSIPK